MSRRTAILLGRAVGCRAPRLFPAEEEGSRHPDMPMPSAIQPLPVPADPADIASTIAAIPALAREVDARTPSPHGHNSRGDLNPRRGTPPTPDIPAAAGHVAMRGWPDVVDWRTPPEVQASYRAVREHVGQELHTPNDAPGLFVAYSRWCDPRHVARVPHADQWDGTALSGHPQPFVDMLPWRRLPEPVPAPADLPRLVDPVADLLWANHQVGRWPDSDPEDRRHRRAWRHHRDDLAADAVPYLADWASWVNVLIQVVNDTTTEPTRAPAAAGRKW